MPLDYGHLAPQDIIEVAASRPGTGNLEGDVGDLEADQVTPGLPGLEAGLAHSMTRTDGDEVVLAKELKGFNLIRRRRSQLPRLARLHHERQRIPLPPHQVQGQLLLDMMYVEI